MAGTDDAILMVEAGANEITEAEILDALDIAHEEIKKLCAAQRELAAAGRQAEDGDRAAGRRHGALRADPRLARRRARRARRRSRTSSSARTRPRRSRRPCSRSTPLRRRGSAPPERRAAVQRAFDKLEKDIIRRRIAVDKRRPDGRAADEIREVTCEVGHRARARTARRSSRAARRRPSRSRRSARAARSSASTRSGSRRPSATSTTTTSRRSRSGRPASCAGPSAVTSATGRSPSGRCCR